MKRRHMIAKMAGAALAFVAVVLVALIVVGSLALLAKLIWGALLG